ncbi:SDR family oxidoreductase [Bythopirellula polymerisocia]|uniref:Putative oxidoreductase UxuB n=1 Tax=Bythopirellula polymerisocia TaxID=2528003 RepID=A0A5C6CKA4_9BACT|nr:SDR family NAD(P)-dependent oxidoreductase [Bythopirellula polymerisocia]TWU23536.1 putative oxidoreductase UxuB [Bythopirellula polymerisocia]
MNAEFLQKQFGFDGQVCVVIGGTGVLGGALCEGIAQAGAHVVVAGRSTERGEERVKAIEKLGGQASFTAVDATSRESLQQLLDTVVTEHGGVDSLINGTGVNSATPYLEITDEELQGIFDANFMGTHLACQTFIPHMVEKGGGSILNIGSVTCFLPLSRVYMYAATKAAILNLTQNMAREFAPQNVRINCLCPGFFPAEQNRKILSPDRTESIMRHTPMNRFGLPEELVGAALLLLSPTAGSFITGTAIYVDGGFTAMTI